MTDRHNYYAFRARYFPSFLGSMFLTLFAVVIATSQVSHVWFGDVADIGMYQVVFLIGASMLLALAGLLISRGRSWGVWGLVAMMVASLLAVLTAYPSNGPGVLVFIYVLGLIFPLLGLLLLNSKLHREMRAEFVALRFERKESSVEARRQDMLKKNRERLRKNKARHK
ncbi:hypothetical protein ACKUFS_21560 [Pseudomonas cannabina]|uniref:Uncharacterized protein n=3 Tax=Pseudomonas syringae group TaxID=136849 RepID=A0A3M3Q6R4_PSECA|nr:MULTISPECIES: hypothetical protein [Pseudomonas syringae group]KPB75371.1 Uncharacterized protein AC507_2347 [Pseudomonas syringae pv. maculicola]MBM0140971.1 hypothetical protein [Pseudomonas cannabina pv. alisalensis]QHE99859.1 hypothetical protein PMA4326_026755 [Pseudomonas syringae pv. maculicola str. ES4326]QQN21932.1 hypothetical protein JGS08_25865 [Pseudomonas cannabina pv. alisalensis]RMN79925.1 hypothetical protein ALQ53_102492 [Pseudomonas cannabina]